MILLSIALGITLIGFFLGTYAYEHGSGDWALNVGGWTFTFGIFLLVVVVGAGFGGKLSPFFERLWSFVVSQIQQLRML